MRIAIDGELVGRKFGKLVLVRILKRRRIQPSGQTKKLGLFQCECGKRLVVGISAVSRGNIVSCGHTRETRNKLSESPEYFAWISAMKRCNQRSHKQWSDYGGRGITFCKRWHDFNMFFLDMGKKPSPKHSIDRIDNDGNYEPSNCRWATNSEQKRNTRNSYWWFVDGKRYETAREASAIVGVDVNTIRRWCRGLNEPTRRYPPKSGCHSIKRYG